VPPLPVNPIPAIQAEQKALNTAGNILPPIKEPFFKRGMQNWPTIVSRWPTYEPCPLHEQFKFTSTTGYEVELNEGDKTYKGSANGGATTSPVENTTTGANNKTLPPNEPGDSITGKDFNVKALQCQLRIHEGEKLVSYRDSKGLPTGGIGHLLRTNEISQYPIGTPIPQSQVDTWFAQDSQTAIKDAQNFIGPETWEKLDEPRKRALADMAFNLGSSRLGQFKTFKKEMQAGNYDQAARQIENTPYYQQVGRRGPAIASQIRSGTDLYGCGAKNPMVKPAG
jgi:lysozyme